MTKSEAQNFNSTGNVYLTHNYTCGVCSSLKDLKVFLTVTDLTNPVKNCILKSLFKFWLSPEDFRKEVSECFQEKVGFSEICSTIWQYNSQNTKEYCMRDCLWNTEMLKLPNNMPTQRSFLDKNHCDPEICTQKINGSNACSDFQWQDGPFRLNSCIQCDECYSGPVFQKYSGRTRRNTGIVSAIRRPKS